ncbi:MAG TPA: hypothetical protein VGK29_00515 [Paludibaculum sp.]|jgi:hypothetical protein
MPIILTISHPDPAKTATDQFTSIWARYVRGFNQGTHCQKCLKGDTSHKISAAAPPLGTEIAFDETNNFDYLYVCGVARGPETERGKRNLHMPLKESPGQEWEMRIKTGFTLFVRNAELLTIPDKRPDLAHLGDRHYGCKNFRFGVGYYGYNPA